MSTILTVDQILLQFTAVAESILTKTNKTMNTIISFQEVEHLHKKLAFANLDAIANHANPKYVDALRASFSALSELKKFL